MNPHAISLWKDYLRECDLSARAASIAIGMSPSYLSVLIARAKTDPANVITPSFEVLQKLSKLLGVSADTLAYGNASAPQKQPRRAALTDVIAWWHQNSGRLENCDKIRESFDIISIPMDGTPQITPLHVGRIGLAGKRIGAGRKPLENALGDLPRKEFNELFRGFREAIDAPHGAFRHTSRRMQVKKPNGPETTEYVSVRMPCTLQGHGKVIVNYCFQS